MNVIASVVVCGLWGYLLYNFEIAPAVADERDRQPIAGGDRAGLGTTYLLRHSPKRVYALCTGIPFVAVGVTVFTAGVESVNMWWLKQADPDDFGRRPRSPAG